MSHTTGNSSGEITTRSVPGCQGVEGIHAAVQLGDGALVVGLPPGQGIQLLDGKVVFDMVGHRLSFLANQDLGGLHIAFSSSKTALTNTPGQAKCCIDL
ncbi:MAG: hypothetical protein ACE5MB_00580 [Anaerolineae bacterium]